MRCQSLAQLQTHPQLQCSARQNFIRCMQGACRIAFLDLSIFLRRPHLHYQEAGELDRAETPPAHAQEAGAVRESPRAVFGFSTQGIQGRCTHRYSFWGGAKQAQPNAGESKRSEAAALTQQLSSRPAMAMAQQRQRSRIRVEFGLRSTCAPSSFW